MRSAQHVDVLRREGELLARAVERSDLDVPVTTCPGWRKRDLIRHIGGVHRWAGTYVGESRLQPMEEDEEAEVMAWPDDASLIDWFRDGHAELVRALESAPPDLVCWSFLPAPSSLAFWARRQAHETTIHRVDAESSGTISSIDPAFAVDGIDELLLGFLSRPGREPMAEVGRSLSIHGLDVEEDWVVRVGSDRLHVSRERGDGDCAVHGTASDLYQLLWNRRTWEDLDVRGDESLLSFWRQVARVRWS